MKQDFLIFTAIGIILNALASLWCYVTDQPVMFFVFALNTGVMIHYLLDKRE